MDLERKIGQLFVVPVNADVKRHVRENHVGGVIWFQALASEAARVNEELQSMAETPLLISADLESGIGMRFTDTTWWPPAMALAATYRATSCASSPKLRVLITGFFGSTFTSATGARM